jgi:hypothetical protein
MAWYDNPVGHGYITKYEGPNTDTPHFADDVETPFHTPITSLVNGVVTDASYQAWGGQIIIKPDPGQGPKGGDLYYYHPDEVDVPIGAHVHIGDIIALSGGETVTQVKQNPSAYPGAKHPTQDRFSTGVHTHVGWETGTVYVAQM